MVIDQIYDDENLTVDTLISLSERKLGNLRFGVGFGTEDKLRGQIGWTQRELFSAGEGALMY